MVMPPASHDGAQSAEPAEGAAHMVFTGIVAALEARRLVPGQRLVEADLAQQFGVSRNSVREALQRLAAEGIAEVTRHKGATIRTLGDDDLRDILDVAERLTGLLARSAAGSAAAGRSTRSLKDTLGLLDEADRQHDPEAFARARRSFYRALLELSGSRELRRLFPLIQMPIVYAHHPVMRLQGIRRRDYAAIVRAVVARDVEAAEAAGMAHVQNVRREITSGPTSRDGV